MNTKRLEWPVIGALFAVQVAFGSLPVAGKVVLAEMGPFALAAVRVGISALVFLPFCYKQIREIPKRDIGYIALWCFFGMAANQVLFLSGLARTHALNATVLVTTIPVFTYVVAVALRKERGSVMGLCGVLLAFCGVLYLIGAEAFTVSSTTWIGDLLLVSNACAFAIYLVMIRPYAESYGSIPVVAIGFVVSALFVVPLGAGQIATVLQDGMTQRATLTLVYVVLGITVFTYFANAWALRRAPSSVVAIFIYLQPLLGTGLAVWILGEEVSSRLAVSAFAVFIGIFMVTRPRSEPATT